MTKRFAEENQYINEYLTSISLAELTDAYIKSKTNKFEPGEQKDIGTIISHMLHKVIKNQNLEEEKDWAAFYSMIELGSGAFGAVNLLTTNPIVVGVEAKIAVKSIFDKAKANKSLSNGQLQSEKGKREFKLLQNMNHSNIMKAYFMWKTSQNKLKIASEYLPWGDLANLLSKYKTVMKARGLPLELVRFYAVEMIKTLGYMRANKILHRDIKPENIMLDHNFHIKFADFGLGVRYDEKDQSSVDSKIYKAWKQVKNKTQKLLKEAAKIKENMEKENQKMVLRKMLK